MAAKGSFGLFCWGFNKYGQLGLGDNSTKETPQLVTKPTLFKDGKKPIASISCGGHYTLVNTTKSTLDTTNDDTTSVVYSCGRGLYGRLGNGCEEDQAIFKPLSTSKDMTSVISLSAGHWHGSLVTVSGQLYSWGYNKGHGVIGLAHDIVTIPQQIPVKVNMSYVSCGFNYTIAISTDGHLYSWGAGRHGVLGHGNYEDHVQPTRIELAGTTMTKVHCGYCHVGAISSEGHLYTWGKGSDGALGHGKDKSDKLIPCQLKELCNVSDVSCSQGEHHSHTLTVTTSGEVYSWGDGYKCKLGHGDDTSKDTPTKIDPTHFKGHLVTSVACGGIHSVAIATGRAIFTWGCGSDGRLGHPEAHGHRYLFLSSVPREVEGFGEKWKPIQVSCSYYHTIALCHQ